mgnify:CR=1 FL=1
MEEGVVRSEKEESAAFAGCACEASGPRLRMWLMDAMPMRGRGGATYQRPARPASCVG